MRDSVVLKNPTVADMVAWLLKQPQDARFRMVDADSMWTISTIHVVRDDEIVWLSGEYHEMSKPDLDP